VYGKFDCYAAQGKNDIVTGLLRGELTWEESLDKLLEIIYRCPMCAACDVNCKRVMDLDIIGVLSALREEACQRGYGPLPAHKEFIQSIQNYDNVWKQPRSRRANWARKLKIKDLSKKGEKAEVLYFVGCTYAYKPGMQDVPLGTARIMKEADIDFGILGTKEPCCGGIIDNVGDTRNFEEIAKRNIEIFEDLGVKLIVTNCPGCFTTFSEKYARLQKKNTEDLPYKVLHATQLVDQLIKDGLIKFDKELNLRVTYHDPCHLGRRAEPYKHWEGKRTKFGLFDPPRDMNRGVNGIYEPPRNILRSIPGIELTEMERIREASWCCGSGGGAKSAYPDFAIATSVERIKEAEATGASILTTACPWCEANLRDGIDASQSKLKVMDVIELAEKAMKKEE